MKIINHSAKSLPHISPLGELLLHTPMVELAVLVEPAPGSYAVYVACVYDNSLVDPSYSAVKDAVMRHGRKLRYRDALSHFPSLMEEKYVS